MNNRTKVSVFDGLKEEMANKLIGTHFSSLTRIEKTLCDIEIKYLSMKRGSYCKK